MKNVTVSRLSVHEGLTRLTSGSHPSWDLEDDHRDLILRQRGKSQMAYALFLSIRPLLKGKNFQL